MRFLYSLVLYLSVPLVLLKLLLRGLKNRAYLKRIPERFGRTPGLKSLQPVIWVHAVSVGEVQASGALVKRLLRSYPRYQVLLTTITPTGAAQVGQLFAGAVEHRYLPYDLPHGVSLFLRRVDPRLLRRGLLEHGYVDSPVTGAHAVAIDLLPPIHRDPFDRMLVAQAQVEGITLLTADAVVARYPGPIRAI